MGTFNNFSIIKKADENFIDSLRIDPNKRNIKAYIGILKFVDKDTLQWVYYMPALDITGYGKTEEKASEMLKFSIGELFNHLLSLSSKRLQVELSNLGWKRNYFRNKEYSKSYVDIDGELQNFNAIDNKVERLSLVA